MRSSTPLNRKVTILAAAFGPLAACPLLGVSSSIAAVCAEAHPNGSLRPTSGHRS